MSTVAVFLFWLRPSSPVEDRRFRRLEGIQRHSFESTAPRVPLFAGRKKPIAAS